MHLLTSECRLWSASDHELQQAGLPEPYWAFAWPGGQALASLILAEPERVHDRVVLDCGAGGAVEGLAARRAGAARVIANDVDPWAAVAAAMNAELNQLELEMCTRDLIGTDEGWDVVLLGDVSYSEELAVAIMPWLKQLVARGAQVLLADPGRGFLPADFGVQIQERRVVRTPADVDPTGSLSWDTHIYLLGMT